MLKPKSEKQSEVRSGPAAFRRLCVETGGRFYERCWLMPAAFRRLCVETSFHERTFFDKYPAAFRRLCVETFIDQISFSFHEPSRLQAAVC